jgi:hypothetical protein
LYLFLYLLNHVCSAARDNEASAHRAAIVASITLNTSPASSYSSYLPNEHTTPPAEDEALSIFGQRKRATERVAEILARARELQQQDVCKSLFMPSSADSLFSHPSPFFFCLSLALSHVSLQQLLGSLSLVRSVERIDPMNPAALALHADDCVCVRLPQCVPVWRKIPSASLSFAYVSLETGSTFVLPQVRHAVSLASGLGSAAEMREYAAEGAAKWLELMRLEDSSDKAASAAATAATPGPQARARLVTCFLSFLIFVN